MNWAQRRALADIHAWSQGTNCCLHISVNILMKSHAIIAGGLNKTLPSFLALS